MALLMQVCTLVVNVLCLPLHLIHAVGLYKLYKHVMPLCLYRIAKMYNKKMHDKKKELFRSLAEFKPPSRQLTLLEIGCGTGTNFQYYPNGCKVICTDPNPQFQRYLTKGMEDNDHLTYDRFVVASGEDMGAVQDNSVDAVVCTLVLCSVDNVTQTLREVHRILRPVSHRSTIENKQTNKQIDKILEICVTTFICTPLLRQRFTINGAKYYVTLNTGVRLGNSEL